MKKSKLFIGVSASIVSLLLVYMIIFGYIDFNLYKSYVTSNEIASIAYSNESASYNINFEYNGRSVHMYRIQRDEKESIDIKVNIEDYKYNGNYYVPLYKNFTMDYTCSVANLESEDSDKNRVNGNIKGSVNAKIIGLCSIKKAKKVVEAQALEAIKKYVIKGLDKST